ncbi:hypothetical protein GCM10027569_05520 [Flindersiella endophytica]
MPMKNSTISTTNRTMASGSSDTAYHDRCSVFMIHGRRASVRILAVDGGGVVMLRNLRGLATQPNRADP